MKKWLLFLVMWLFGFSVHAQFAELVNKPHAEHYWVHRQYWLPKMLDPKRDSTAIFLEIEQVRSEALKNNDAELEMTAQMMELFYYIIVPNPPHPMVQSQFEKSYKLAEELNLTHAMASIEREWGMHYLLRVRNYELCFEHYYNMYELLQYVDPTQFPELPSCYHDLGKAHYFFRDYNKAIKVFLEAVEAAKLSSNYEFTPSDMNSVGLCYQKLNKLDSAEYYFQKALALTKDTSLPKSPVHFNSRAWIGIISGNIGYNHFLKGDYEKAIPLLEKDIASAMQDNDLGLVAGSLVPLGAIEVAEGNLELAEDHLLKARRFIAKVEQPFRLEKLYPELSKLYTAKGEKKLALAYLDSAVAVKDSLALEFSKLQVSRIQQKLEREQYLAELEELESERELKLYQRNGLIVVVVLLIIIVMLVFRALQSRYRVKQLELQKAEDELKLASEQLSVFTKHLAEKNQQIEELSENSGDAVDALSELQKITILTTEDWAYFKQLFEKVHVGYLSRLTQKLPDLSPAETRFIALSKLELSSKEMAAVLGVGQAAIRQYRLRLRKRLDVSNQKDLQEFIRQI
ncbi:MAG: tetratricopeptide repeat protein [Flavobacteriales bacterium]